MTITRATIYIGGAALLVAWLSSAASMSLQPTSDTRPVAVPEPHPIDRLGAEVRERAAKLKARLSTTPPPEVPRRNPFAFGRSEGPPPRGMIRAAAALDEPAAPAPPPEPSLTLVGIAAKNAENGPVRTAMLATASDELVIAGIEDVVLQRYRVAAIGPDAVELIDLTTGATRRLALQRP